MACICVCLHLSQSLTHTHTHTRRKSTPHKHPWPPRIPRGWLPPQIRTRAHETRDSCMHEHPHPATTTLAQFSLLSASSLLMPGAYHHLGWGPGATTPSQGTSLAYEHLSAGVLPRHPSPSPDGKLFNGFRPLGSPGLASSYLLCSPLATPMTNTALWSSVLHPLGTVNRIWQSRETAQQMTSSRPLPFPPHSPRPSRARAR